MPQKCLVFSMERIKMNFQTYITQVQEQQQTEWGAEAALFEQEFVQEILSNS